MRKKRTSVFQDIVVELLARASTGTRVTVGDKKGTLYAN